MGRTTLAEWRDYAGPSKRASQTNAHKRAIRRGAPVKTHKDGSRFPETTLDDWFNLSELNRSRGWEVHLGDAFFDKDHFSDYLEAFVKLHDERQRNDWESYHRLLADYVGVGTDGHVARWQRPPSCLRAVLLGYLKTYEVVAGGNCLSCNHCVPDENFTASQEERRAVVVRLGRTIQEMLDDAERLDLVAPDHHFVANLVSEIRKEEEQGRALATYVAGWSARLLADTPGHKAASWIRLTAMVEGLIQLQPSEFVEIATRLAASGTSPEVAELKRLAALANGKADQHVGFCDLCADLHYRCGELLEAHMFYCELTTSLRSSASDGQLKEAFERLAAMYGPAGLLNDPLRYHEVQLEAARLSGSVSAGEDAYSPLVSDWQWQEGCTGT